MDCHFIKYQDYEDISALRGSLCHICNMIRNVDERLPKRPAQSIRRSAVEERKIQERDEWMDRTAEHWDNDSGLENRNY